MLDRVVRCMCVCAIICASGCMRTSSEMWEDLKTAGRYMGRSVDAACGKEYESRMLTADDEFTGPYDEEFIPLKDNDLKRSQFLSDAPLAQPKGIPGKQGIPSLAEFYSPPDTLRHFFQAIHFETDEHVMRDKLELQGLAELAKYLKQNPNLYIMVNGHTDERASADYNMALGMRRANFVRSYLVKLGVDQNRVYTVSHGKEKPVAMGHSPEIWKQNRRVEFKMFQK